MIESFDGQSIFFFRTLERRVWDLFSHGRQQLVAFLSTSFENVDSACLVCISLVLTMVYMFGSLCMYICCDSERSLAILVLVFHFVG